MVARGHNEIMGSRTQRTQWQHQEYTGNQGRDTGSKEKLRENGASAERGWKESGRRDYCSPRFPGRGLGVEFGGVERPWQEVRRDPASR